MQGNVNSPETCLLLAADRSGTHFLRSMLRNVPGVLAPEEICNPAVGSIRTYPGSFLRFRAEVCMADADFFYPTYQIQVKLLDRYLDFLRSWRPNARHYLLDIKYSHVQGFNPCWWEIVNRPFLIDYALYHGIRIIHLVRQKPYRTTISELYAWQSRIWQTDDPKNLPSLRIRIDREKLRERTLRLVKTINLFSRWLEGCRCETISYESLVREPDSCLAKLRDFLDLKEDIPARSPYIKITPPYEQAIENFADIADLVDVDLKDISHPGSSSNLTGLGELDRNVRADDEQK